MRRSLPPGIWGLGLVVIGPLVVAFFWRHVFTDLILAHGDTFLYFYPYWDYRNQSLLAGRLPLWNPYLFMGVPFLANSQAGVLYPLNWPLIFFSAPAALKASIVLHVLIAALGAYAFARRALSLMPLSALLSAALFGLGGYLLSQVEHINQLQGLAWFPWLLLSAQAIAAGRAARGLAQRLQALAPAAVLLALQLLAGHTQSTFISLAGVVIYTAAVILTEPATGLAGPPWPVSRPTRLRRTAFGLAGVVLLALLLAAGQLLPTLELSGRSLRGGGLPWREAVSFSLDPRLAGRALLPPYGRPLFSEFVAYLGVAGLALAALGAAQPGRARWPLLALALAGLFLALGAFNPLYAALAAIPPFSLFRAPARWLFLFAFGAAMLAGHGLSALNGASPASTLRRLAAGLVPVLLVLITPLASSLTPPGETGPLGAPALIDVAGWLLGLAVIAGLLLAPLPSGWRRTGLALAAIVELFAAGQILPHNNLTTPEAYSSVRPAMTQLLDERRLQEPASRFLSMSALRFDPGDLAELRGELDPQLPPGAVYDAVVAAKHKEVLSPNLPLRWGVPAVDGYDGGVLPLKLYAAFTSLFTGAPSADGRLRENLSAAPDPRLLSLVNARYLITDKVDDAWVDDVFYDLQFSLRLAEGETAPIAHVPAFQATALGLVADSYSGEVRLTFADGSASNLPISSSRVRFDAPTAPVEIVLAGPLHLRGLSLIDERTGAFHSLSLGPYRLVHSGDVKIYDNLGVLPRAFVLGSVLVVRDDAQALATLGDPAFDPASAVILDAPLSPALAASAGPARPAAITHYSAGRITLTAEGPGVLLLTDAYYPGWVARVDGDPAALLRADVMFRAVVLPAGVHEVEFRYKPASVRIGLIISGLSWAGLLIAAAAARIKKTGAPGAG